MSHEYIQQNLQRVQNNKRAEKVKQMQENCSVTENKNLTNENQRSPSRPRYNRVEFCDNPSERISTSTYVSEPHVRTKTKQKKGGGMFTKDRREEGRWGITWKQSIHNGPFCTHERASASITTYSHKALLREHGYRKAIWYLGNAIDIRDIFKDTNQHQKNPFFYRTR